MRRREKRLLQVTGLLLAALLFLPNVGLWSLYRDRVFDPSPGAVDGPAGGSAAQVGGPGPNLDGSGRAVRFSHI